LYLGKDITVIREEWKCVDEVSSGVPPPFPPFSPYPTFRAVLGLPQWKPIVRRRIIMAIDGADAAKLSFFF